MLQLLSFRTTDLMALYPAQGYNRITAHINHWNKVFSLAKHILICWERKDKPELQVTTAKVFPQIMR